MNVISKCLKRIRNRRFAIRFLSVNMIRQVYKNTTRHLEEAEHS
jgi:hypothetical protein